MALLDTHIRGLGTARGTKQRPEAFLTSQLGQVAQPLQKDKAEVDMLSGLVAA